MFETITNTFEAFTSKTDAIILLKKDHDKVKQLFEDFKNAKDLRRKKRIAAEAILELKLHAEVEEKIFYPSVRSQVEADIMNEADEEHHVAKLLIAELDQMDGSEDHWEAKFTVLAENIRHHIEEEESEMMPQARALNIDFETIGRKINAMKDDLKRNGIPATAEEKLMASTRARTDSPAMNARLKKPVAVRAAAKKSVASKAKPKAAVASKARAKARH